MADEETVENRSYPKSVQPGIPRLAPLPEGWLRLQLGAVLTPVRRPVRVEAHQEYRLLKARRSRGGIVERERKFGRDILTSTQFWARADDFLISRRQIAHGACGIVAPSLDLSLVSNEYATLRPTKLLDAGFLRHWPHSIYFQQTCFHSSIGVHVEKLVFNLEKWLTWEFNVPPLVEQRRIASVLDILDETLNLTDRLVQFKTRRIVAVRQKLLGCGSRRKLGEIASVSFSGVDKKTTKSEKIVRLCNYLDVLRNKNLTNALNFSVGSASAREIERFTIKLYDVVFTKDSEVAGEIAEVSVVTEPLDNVVCGYHLAVARPIRDKIGGRYLAHLMRLTSVRSEFIKRTNGVVRFGLTLEAVKEIELPVPSIERQREVVELLDVLDDEIELLNRRVELLRKQKRGLMQKLLTGQIPVPESIDRLMPGDLDEASA